MKIQITRSLVLIISSIMILSFQATLYAQDGEVFFNPDTSFVLPLDTFEVNIEVDADVTGIHCFMVTIDFDRSLIELLDVFEGALFQGSTFPFWNDNGVAYDIGNCLLGYGLYTDGPGVLATMKFRAQEYAGVTPLTFTFIDITDTLLNQIEVIYTNGLVTIMGDQNPTYEVISPASGDFHVSLPTLTINFNDDAGLDRAYYQIDDCEGAWLELWWYNSGSSDTTIDWTVPSLSEGLHNIYFRVNDDAGQVNIDTCSYSWSFFYDFTGPTAQVTAPTSGGIYDYLPTLTIEFNDNLGLDRAYYQIDDCEGTWTELWPYNSENSDTTIDWAVPSVSAGPHSIYFKVTDDAGNSNADTCSYSWSFTFQDDCDCEPGNANGDALTNIFDVTYVISYLYKGGPPPTPYAICSGDPNGLGCTCNIFDATYLISFLYKEGPAPVTCEEWVAACGPLLKDIGK